MKKISAPIIITFINALAILMSLWLLKIIEYNNRLYGLVLLCLGLTIIPALVSVTKAHKLEGFPTQKKLSFVLNVIYIVIYIFFAFMFMILQL